MEEKITTRRKVLIGMTSAVGAVGASLQLFHLSLPGIQAQKLKQLVVQ